MKISHPPPRKMKYSVRVKFHKDFVKVEGDTIIVGVMAKPEKGRANEELLKKIARHFKVPLLAVRLVSGAKSKNKVVEVECNLALLT